MKTLNKKSLVSSVLITLLISSSFILLLNSVSASYIDFEDYTQNAENANVTVDSDVQVSGRIYRNYQNWLVYDYGVNFFTDFTHRFEFMFSDTSGMSNSFIWCLANIGIHDVWWFYNNRVDYDFISICVYMTDIQIWETTATGLYQTGNIIDITVDVNYYFEVIKLDDLLTLNVYSDSGYSVLFGTFHQHLQSDYSFRYHYAYNSRDETRADYHEFVLKNYDLNLGVDDFYITFYLNDGGVFKADGILKTNGTVSVYNSSQTIILDGVTFNSSYIFSSFECIVFNSTENNYSFQVNENNTIWCYFGLSSDSEEADFIILFAIVVIVFSAFIVLMVYDKKERR